MAVTARRFTVEEVHAWPDDGNRYELVDGVLLVTPAPAMAHQVVTARLVAELHRRIGARAGIYVASPGEIVREPGVTLQPDILVYRTDSLGRKWREVEDHLLAVEIWSPSSVIYDRDIKRDAYLQLGVREVWLVDLARRRVLVSRPDQPRDVAHEQQLPWRVPGLPEVAPISLGAVFEGVPPGQDST